MQVHGEGSESVKSPVRGRCYKTSRELGSSGAAVQAIGLGGRWVQEVEDLMLLFGSFCLVVGLGPCPSDPAIELLKNLASVKIFTDYSTRSEEE